MLDAQSGEIRRVTVAWESALQLRVLKSRPRPCGYWLAPTETDAVQRLRLLGVEVQQLDELGELRGETYREIGREDLGGAPASAAANAGAATRLQVQTMPALLDVAAGGYYVSLEQPLAQPGRRRARAGGAGELRRQRRHRRRRRRSAYSSAARDPHDERAVAVEDARCKDRGVVADKPLRAT